MTRRHELSTGPSGTSEPPERALRIEALERELQGIPTTVLPYDPEKRKRYFQAMRELSYLRGEPFLLKL